MNATIHPPVRERSYFAQERLEVISLLPRIQGKAFLDLGCGEGGLGRQLKARGSGPVVGIEAEAQAAAEAARHYDRVYTADLDRFAPPFAAESFDHLICADILEHLQDPWSLLARFRPALRLTGTLVASIPNVGNVDTLGQLLRGRFGYVDWGVMDQSHLRFFTRHGIEEMFCRAGYVIDEIRPKRDPNAEAILELWRQQEMARRLRDLTVLLGGAPHLPSDDDLREMLTIQYLVIARRRD